jgi:hypothetical protein
MAMNIEMMLDYIEKIDGIEENINKLKPNTIDN